jgi:LysM repeat protein
VAEGERVYVDEKKGRGATKTTVVRAGETMHGISQREGVKLAKLYKFNDFSVGHQPMVGDEIRLRPVNLIKRVQGK